MIINSGIVITDLEGQPIKDGDKAVTFGTVVKQGMLATPREDNLPPEQKRKRYLLAKRFVKDGMIELSQSEIDLIKEVVGRHYITVIVGKIDEILDQQHPSQIETERKLVSVPEGGCV